MFSYLDGYVSHHQKARRDTINIDLTKNELITPNGLDSFNQSYIYKNDGETNPQDVYARISAYFGSNPAHAQRVYGYLSNHWCMTATPISANGGTSRGRPISCNTNEIYDSRKSIAKVLLNENFWLATGGAGVGTYFGNIRSIGEKIKTGTTGGIFAFLPMLEALIRGSNQGSLRRSNAAVYLPVWHPEIKEFIKMRLQIQGGDPKRLCPGLHHGVILNKEFKNAVEKGLPYNLRSPKTGEVLKTIPAREIWYDILDARVEKGEPYIIFDEAVQEGRSDVYKFHDFYVKTSNLCVAPETPILTDKGYAPIKQLSGKTVNVWNGREFSKTKIERTSSKAFLRKVSFSDGTHLWVTDEHKFYVKDTYASKEREVRAHSLKVGSKIIKTQYPTISGDVTYKNPYVSGFYTADGTTLENGALVYLYGDKAISTVDIIEAGGKIRNINVEKDRDTFSFNKEDLMTKFEVPMKGSIKTKLEWFAGYCDGDGTIARNGNNESLQFSSVNEEFLNSVRLLLNTLGVTCTVSLSREEGEYYLPDGKGGIALYKCKALYRGCVSSYDLQYLLSLGLNFRRLEVKKRKVQRAARQFIKVVANEDLLREDETYCANEPIRHRLVFNGHETGNCTEIFLKTGLDQHKKERTGVCCLSSLNLAYWDEWKDDPLFIPDMMEFLDNVLSDYIEIRDPHIEPAIYAAYRERSVGLGVMGLHTLFQKKKIAFDSLPAMLYNKAIFKHIKYETKKASYNLALERGPCPDAQEAGLMERFANKTAIAPTASISVLAGEVSPGIEPIASNVFSRRTIAGNQSYLNPEMVKMLESYGLNTPETLASIAKNKGSVQHLPISEQDKAVFKTAREIDQRYIVDMAADRQPDLCQGQSVNLFIPYGYSKLDLHKLHMRAWDKGNKSLYYLRAESAVNDTELEAFSIDKEEDDQECLACQ